MKIGFFNGITGEQIVREATAEEVAERNNEVQTFLLEEEAKIAKAQAIIEAKKQAIVKLIELGIDPKAFNLEAEQSTPIVATDE